MNGFKYKVFGRRPLFKILFLIIVYFIHVNTKKGKKGEREKGPVTVITTVAVISQGHIVRN